MELCCADGKCVTIEDNNRIKLSIDCDFNSSIIKEIFCASTNKYDQANFKMIPYINIHDKDELLKYFAAVDHYDVWDQELLKICVQFINDENYIDVINEISKYNIDEPKKKILSCSAYYLGRWQERTMKIKKNLHNYNKMFRKIKDRYIIQMLVFKYLPTIMQEYLWVKMVYALFIEDLVDEIDANEVYNNNNESFITITGLQFLDMNFRINVNSGFASFTPIQSSYKDKFTSFSPPVFHKEGNAELSERNEKFKKIEIVLRKRNENKDDVEKMYINIFLCLNIISWYTSMKSDLLQPIKITDVENGELFFASVVCDHICEDVNYIAKFAILSNIENSILKVRIYEVTLRNEEKDDYDIRCVNTLTIRSLPNFVFTNTAIVWAKWSKNTKAVSYNWDIVDIKKEIAMMKFGLPITIY